MRSRKVSAKARRNKCAGPARDRRSDAIRRGTLGSERRQRPRRPRPTRGDPCSGRNRHRPARGGPRLLGPLWTAEPPVLTLLILAETLAAIGSERGEKFDCSFTLVDRLLA